jgi:RNA polymerase sigma-70 factor (ECF subfamily)
VPADELASAMLELWRAAHAAWPAIGVERARFEEFVSERIGGAGDPVAAVRAARGPDLLIACGCAEKDAAALDAFERECMPLVAATLRGMGASADAVAEQAQQIRTRLLVDGVAGRARIADYAGRGDLRRWVRAAAARLYLNALRDGKRERVADDQRVFDAAAAPGLDPELAHMKALYRAELQEAFVAALAELADRDQNLLRYHHLDGLTMDELAALYRVHRATVHRWLAAAREQLAVAVETRLRHRLQVSERGFHSIRRLVESQIDLALSREL